MELIGKFLGKPLVSKNISLEKAHTFNTSHFVDEKDNDVSFLTNNGIVCVLWCTFTPAVILFIYKLGLQNGGDVGGRYTA